MNTGFMMISKVMLLLLGVDRRSMHAYKGDENGASLAREDRTLLVFKNEESSTRRIKVLRFNSI